SSRFSFFFLVRGLSEFLKSLLDESRFDDAIEIGLALDGAGLAIDRQEVLEVFALEAAVVRPGLDGGRQLLPDRLEYFVGRLRGVGNGGVFAKAVREVAKVGVRHPE